MFKNIHSHGVGVNVSPEKLFLLGIDLHRKVMFANTTS